MPDAGEYQHPRMMHGCSPSGLTTEPDPHPWEPACDERGSVPAAEPPLMEPVGWIQPGVAFEYRLHYSCSGKPQEPGRSRFYDHSKCFRIFRVADHTNQQQMERERDEAELNGSMDRGEGMP